MVETCELRMQNDMNKLKCATADITIDIQIQMLIIK